MDITPINQRPQDTGIAADYPERARGRRDQPARLLEYLAPLSAATLRRDALLKPAAFR